MTKILYHGKEEIILGLFTKEKEQCPLCGKNFNRIINAKFQLNDGNIVCQGCMNVLGLIYKPDEDKYRNIPFQDLKSMYANLNKAVENRKTELSVFNPAIKIGSPITYIWFDEKNEIIEIKLSLTMPEQRFLYSEIANFSGNEDGETLVKSGLGSAVVGGVLAGPAGLVAGAVIGKGKKGKDVVNSLSIMIEFTSGRKCTLVLLSKQTKVDSTSYSIAKSNFNQITAMLDKILQTKNTDRPNEKTMSVADEIRSFKGLLDDGIITVDEFNAKKNEILNR